MLDSDSLSAAEAMERELGGTHFWDGERLAGRAFASALGGDGQVAWDVYLSYSAGAAWADPAPVPDDWAHQLGAAPWADPAKYAWGEALSEALSRLGTQGL